MCIPLKETNGATNQRVIRQNATNGDGVLNWELEMWEACYYCSDTGSVVFYLNFNRNGHVIDHQTAAVAVEAFLQLVQVCIASSLFAGNHKYCRSCNHLLKIQHTLSTVHTESISNPRSVDRDALQQKKNVLYTHSTSRVHLPRHFTWQVQFPC
jgi:hypothetical protein